jgi:transcriptional regulator with XRE-family HTH domain
MASSRDKDWPLDFGPRLRAERLRQGLTLHQLASMAGLSYTCVQYLEIGRTEPTLRSALLLAAALGIEVSFLHAQAPKPLDNMSPCGDNGHVA